MKLNNKVYGYCAVLLGLMYASIATSEVLECKYFNKHQCRYGMQFKDGSVNYKTDPLCMSKISKDDVGAIHVLDTDKLIFSPKATYAGAETNLFHNNMLSISKNGHLYSLNQKPKEKRPEWGKELLHEHNVSKRRETEFLYYTGYGVYPLILHTVHPTKENGNSEPVYIAITIEDDIGFGDTQDDMDTYQYIKYYYCY